MRAALSITLQCSGGTNPTPPLPPAFPPAATNKHFTLENFKHSMAIRSLAFSQHKPVVITPAILPPPPRKLIEQVAATKKRKTLPPSTCTNSEERDEEKTRKKIVSALDSTLLAINSTTSTLNKAVPLGVSVFDEMDTEEKSVTPSRSPCKEVGVLCKEEEDVGEASGQGGGDGSTLVDCSKDNRAMSVDPCDVVVNQSSTLLKRETSQLEGPTPVNSYGFKISQSALQGSHDLHDVS